MTRYSIGVLAVGWVVVQMLIVADVLYRVGRVSF